MILKGNSSNIEKKEIQDLLIIEQIYKHFITNFGITDTLLIFKILMMLGYIENITVKIDESKPAICLTDHIPLNPLNKPYREDSADLI